MIPSMPMPIASMLDLTDLTLSGCEGGIEIVMLCSLPDDRESDMENSDARTPPPIRPISN